MSAEFYLKLSDQDLIKRTVYARNTKIKSIRKERFNLSVKQRYCLAQWLSENI